MSHKKNMSLMNSIQWITRVETLPTSSRPYKLKKNLIFIRFELYAVKVARTVPRGGKNCEIPTYLNRPYAALLVLAGRHMNLR